MKNKKIMINISIIIIITIFLIISILILLKNKSYKEIKNDLNVSTSTYISLESLYGNLTEYDNPEYMATLTQEQKNNISTDLDKLFYLKCQVQKDCTISFLSTYIDLKENLGISAEEIMKNKETEFLAAYSKIPINLTENELKRFEIPLLTKLCNIGILNQTEKDSWGKRILNIEKSDTSIGNYKQILYFIQCLNISNIDKINYAGINREEINNELCSISSNLNIINNCNFLVNLRIKKFCGIQITEDDKTLADIHLSENYNSYYIKNCQNILSKEYSIFFESV
jgi:hypothetical protein